MFENIRNCTKCQVLVDYNIASYDSTIDLELSFYLMSSDDGEIDIRISTL